MMGSALGGADFEWAKTGDLRSEYMDTSETLGNDLDKVDIDPQFQVWPLPLPLHCVVDIDPQFQVWPNLLLWCVTIQLGQNSLSQVGVDILNIESNYSEDVHCTTFKASVQVKQKPQMGEDGHHHSVQF